MILEIGSMLINLVLLEVKHLSLFLVGKSTGMRIISFQLMYMRKLRDTSIQILTDRLKTLIAFVNVLVISVSQLSHLCVRKRVLVVVSEILWHSIVSLAPVETDRSFSKRLSPLVFFGIRTDVFII